MKIDRIYIRAEVEGKWGTHTLAELLLSPKPKVYEQAMVWMSNRMTPDSRKLSAEIFEDAFKKGLDPNDSGIRREIAEKVVNLIPEDSYVMIKDIANN